jgi:hypothetical protein
MSKCRADSDSSVYENFFEHCDLLDKKTNQLSDPELGAHLLHYIATGKINAPEYDMIFEKFLCNIPLHQSINRHIKLSRKHKTQVKNLIESVQHNWSAMKTSSAELLQNEFFNVPENWLSPTTTALLP